MEKVELNDVNMVNKYTGEYLPFKTVSSIKPDKGVKNTMKDLCRKEDFEPISRVVARFLRSGGVEKVIASEYAYDEKNKPSIDEDSAFDYVDYDSDLIDNQLDIEDYINRKIASGASDFASEVEQVGTEERVKQSDEGPTGENGTQLSE